MKKYYSPARKIYLYHVLGIPITGINKEYEIYSISSELNKYGLPADNGKNIGNLKELRDFSISENDLIECIRLWIEVEASNRNKFSGTSLGFEDLKNFVKKNIRKFDGRGSEIEEEERSELSEGELELKDSSIHSLDFVKEITIEKFKKIHHASLELDRLNCLVGPNNSGKSSILQAIHFSNTVLNTIDNFGAETEMKLNRNNLNYFPPGSISGIATKRYNQLGDPESPVPSRFSILYSSGDKIQFDCSYFDDCIDTRIDTESIPLIEHKFSERDLSTVFVTGLSGISDEEYLLVKPEVDEIAAKGNSNLVFSNILYMAKQLEDEWLILLDYLGQIYGTEYFIDVSLKKTQKGYLIKTNIEYPDRNGEKNLKIPLHSAGTGFLQILQILIYIFVYKPRILILDEPDSHLHPNLQKKLIEVLAELAEDRSFQLVISTHSIYILDAIENIGGKIFITDSSMNNDVRIVEDYNRFRVLMNLGALDAYNKISSSDLDFILLTEDTSLSHAGRYKPTKNRDFIRTLIEYNLHNKDLKYEILSYRGASNKEIASAMSEIISTLSPQVKVLIHRDRDFLDQDGVNKFITMCNESHAYSFVTKYPDLECYFSTPEHLKNVIKDFDEEKYLQEINQMTGERKFKKDMINKIMQDRKVNKEKAEKLFESDPESYRRGKELFSLAYRFSNLEPKKLIVHTSSLRDENLQKTLKKIEAN
ncbi:AAA family ATPase [Rothia nasimurium]|uniref:AAA family ATPase n=1 Tax=Rothia nasimurium TaxID=85336 RepID=UPI001F1DC908|nr:ATP-binding protein [Rothia nasimurium]